jgi:FMN phosphatase YigB (HAD superfamily)
VSSRPTLLVDIGGTLLERTAESPVSRVVKILLQLVPEVAAAEAKEIVVKSLQTGLDRPNAIETLTASLPKTPDLRTKVSFALAEESSDYQLKPGANELLDAGRATGFRIFACTNMTAWQHPLPIELASRIDGVFASCIEGAVKQDPAFWAGLIERRAVDPTTAIMIGDNLLADGARPSEAGICSFVVNEYVSLPEVARWISCAPQPPDGVVAAVGGRVMQWAGRPVWAAPQLTDLVEPVTRRRVRLHFEAKEPPVHTMLLRRRGRSPALLLPGSGRSRDGIAWVSALTLQRPVRPPADLVAALNATRLTDQHLSPESQRHLYAMVREAKNPAVRAQRVDDVLSYLRDESKGAPP